MKEFKRVVVVVVVVVVVSSIFDRMRVAVAAGESRGRERRGRTGGE